MDEVQSWWEVPTIAHFCYVFRAAFNLFYIEIGELEAAILNIQDPEMCMSLEQIITRLLQGCYEENEVTSNNWEEKLHELFKYNCEDGENPLENNAFAFLSPRSKVEVLLKLCEFRLDADGVLEAIKDIPSEDMQASCVGNDSENNSYWYFYDERLYKEGPSALTKKSRKSEQQSGKGKNMKNNSAKKTTRERKSKSDDSNKSWSVVCHNLSDWETLMKSFSKSRYKQEKELVQEMKKKYLPLLTEVVAEKDRLLRKRFLELAPKRVSQRISKVQAQKRMEEQMVAEANEKRRIEMEQERIKKEAEKKKKEIEDRRKRAEAREKNIQERTWRAQQRDMMRGADVDDFSSDEDKRTNTRSRNVSVQKQIYDDEDEESSDEDDKRTNTRSRNVSVQKQIYDDEDKESSEEEEEEASDNDDASQSESENEVSAKRQSNNDESEISDSDKESNKSTPIRKTYINNGSSVSQNCVQQNNIGRASVIQNSYGVSKWNVDGDSKEQKIHIVQYAYDEPPNNKRLKPNESNYNNGPVNSVSANDARPSYYNESHAYHPLLHRNLNSCSKITSPAQVIRIDFINPSKPQISR
ncbi:Cat eye syndrome critical region protein 2 like protein [Argiope bruennichi]|uniref:Cat eye syndrome critical region protein 2 like protein n=1 Tax=Argiope bruennichi TaxID=94029 RepID=A0A8T0E4H0_ARGBR|nr:Cat eye syndrome critical region protein 2 like protein [Argiope bruennichi]